MKIHKYLLPLIMTVLLMICFVTAYLVYEFDNQNEFPISVLINGREKISFWEDDSNDSSLYYCFLPSDAELDKCVFQIDTSKKVLFEDNEVTNQSSLLEISLNSIYCFYIGSKKYNVCFLKSQNIPTMYLELREGGIEFVKEKKGNTANVDIKIYNSDGQVNYESVNFQDKILGHGNSTWVCDKKPYNLELKNPAGLLGMKQAKNWILLANAADQSNLKNKIVYDFSKRINAFLWTPQCEYINVYIDGEYQGLYLLSEKVEVNPERLNIPEQAYLFSMDFEYRTEELKNPFQTKNGQTIEIRNPKYCSEDDKNRLKVFLESFEDAIYKEEDGQSNDIPLWIDYIDINSWVNKFLVEEVFGNIDAGFASQFFYLNLESSDKKIYAGPIWDYDGTLGSAAANAFMANRVWKRANISSYWYSTLYKKELFYKELTDVYKKEFLPELSNLTEYGIASLADKISSASYMNSIRWRTMFGDTNYKQNVVDIQNFLKDRIEWLNDIWINGEKYYTIRIDYRQSEKKEDSKNYIYYSIKEGDTFSDFPNPEDLGIENFAAWIDEATGQEYDINAPVLSDVNIKVKVNLSIASNDNETDNSLLSKLYLHRNIIAFLCFLIPFSLFGIALLINDIKMNGCRKK